MISIQFFTSIVTVLVGVGGLYLAFVKWQSDREDRQSAELLREDVFSWANECIDCLQTLSVLVEKRNSPLFEGVIFAQRRDLMLRTSVLIERGRLFFLNDQSVGDHSRESASYRGYRPIILDQLVLAHQLASEWPEDEANFETLARMCASNFVTLMQKEVGRNKTLSPEASKVGVSIRLREIIKDPASFVVKF